MSRWLGRVADALPTAVAQPAFHLWQRLSALAGAEGAFDDGLPMPPPYLRVLTAGSADAGAFSVLGARTADALLDLAAGEALELPSGASVLEFGVGCGRVARWLTSRRPDLAFHGCDVNPELLAWSRAHLPGRYNLTNLDPPLPYADGAFRLVYALSVFTHMHETPARAWFSGLARVTEPGGLAVLSYLDERLPQAEPIRAALATDGFAVRREGAEGSNLLCGYFTAAGFSARVGGGWGVVRTLASDESGVGQALALLRRV